MNTRDSQGEAEAIQAEKLAQESLDATRAEVTEEIERLKAERNRLGAAWGAEQQRLSQENRRLAETLSAQQQEFAGEIARVRADELRSRTELADTYRNSTSWRITAPLRAVSKALRSLSGANRFHDASSAAQARSAAGSPPSEDFGGDLKSAMRAGFKTRLNIFLSASGNIRLPSDAAPDISILLVLYNQAELTFACLSSIAEVTNCSALRVEVVIVDNGSTDATAALLQRIEGANIIRNFENLHFLKGANHAASHARGKYLLFLNNDALLMPGALEASLRTCAAEPDVGAVGGRIVLPDGSLQEAGSIVWNDGVCLGYGRGGKPDGPEFMFRRDVDFCSGAFLLTPRALFESMGRFDERYVPAYYEETDYCLRLWESGRRVVFDPEVVILHYEFGSSSTSSKALELQQRNWTIFRDRHAAWLESQLPSSQANQYRARSRSDAKRVLFIEDRVPHPKLGAGYPRSSKLLRELVAAGADVTMFPMFSHSETWEGIRRSVPDSVEVMYGSSAADLRPFLQARQGFFDAIVICRPHNMKEFLLATEGRPELTGGARVIYDAEAIFARRSLLQRKLAGEAIEPRQAQQMIADEVEFTRAADAIISVSSEEKAQFESHGVGPVFVLGHTITPAPTQAPFAARTDLLFVGAIHGEDAPNAESLHWFAREIWPLLKHRLGADIRLKVVGINRAPSIAALADQGLDLVGAVDDLYPWFDRARVVLAPTRIAAGIPLKLYEAAAHGVPTVATDLLALQTGWEPGKDLLAASSAADFASAVARLYEDQQLWESIRASALERVACDCSGQRFGQTVRLLLASIPAKPAPVRTRAHVASSAAASHPAPAASSVTMIETTAAGTPRAD